MTLTILSAGAGLLLAVLYSASPLSVWAIAAGVVVCLAAGRGLPQGERRILTALLASALAARGLVVVVTFLSDLPALNDLSVGALAGDEAYYLGRALRARDIILGYTDGRYDYFVATDEYGRTSYLTLLTLVQIVFGPTPYGMRLVNALLFVGGATVLFGVARRAFGPMPAFAGLAVLLFLPSLFVASVSLLKESLYFFISSVLVACVVGIASRPSARTLAVSVPAAAACLWLLNDLRRGALVLAVASITLGLVIRLVAGRPWRMAAAGAALTAGIAVMAASPDARVRAVDAVESVAKTHAGHVFTVGHAYKLMDAGFYVRPESPAAWDLQLTEPQAARFLVRAVVSFVVTPWPWELASTSEVIFLPEHVAWYVIVALWPVGVVAGWRRQPLVVSLLIGFALPTAAALALTNGNVGTLLRLRGLVTPYLIWVSALGACAAAEAILARRSLPGSASRWRWAHEGTAR